MSEIDRRIGRNIRAARRRAGLTQAQTAERLHLSLIHYGRHERGEKPVSLARLCAIAQTLGTGVPALLAGCIPPSPDEWPEGLTAHQREMLYLAETLGEDAQAFIHRLYLFLRAEGRIPPISS